MLYDSSFLKENKLTDSPPQLIVPANLKSLQSQPGTHRRGIKGIIFGPAKSGKSYFLAHMPKPRVLLDCGEGGIQPYLEEGDICLTIESAQSYLDAMSFIKTNQHIIASVGIDPITALYQDWMDDWSNKLGGEIAGSDWRKVKPPWKLALRSLMRAPFHCFFAAHQKETWFGSDEPERKGQKMPLLVKAQDTANVEKSVPYTVDLLLRSDNVVDQMRRPTAEHRIIFYGGRIPLSLVGELYIGREWLFNSMKRPNPWNEVITPLLDKWSMGAVDHLGISNPEHFEAVRAEVLSTGSTFTLGEIIKLLDSCPSKNLEEYNEWWQTNIASAVNTLDKAAFKSYILAHEAKKDFFAAKAEKKKKT